MREIKFRAWDKTGKWMVGDRTTKDRLNSFPKTWELMQYTGLLDKKGKEVYCGDIYEEMSWIDWCDKCCSFELFMVDFGCSNCSGDVSWGEVVEDMSRHKVIGNKWQNPELLEETK